MKAAIFVLLALAAVSSAYKVSVSPTTETIGEGFRQLITFELDEPIICPVQADRECAVVIKLTNSHPDQVTLDNCHVKWTAGQWQTKRFVWARAVEDFVDDKEMTFTIKTEPIESPSAYYNGFDPEDIVLTTKPRPSAVCSATGDPHYTTFDKHYYHIYAPGRVVFYKSTNPNHNFEVQTDMYSFARPAVHCAIAAREDNDIVVISLCGDGHNIQYRRSCGSSTCRSNGYPKVSITSGNNPNYIINFASGAQVRAQVAYWGAIGKRYMNVYATAPGQDWKQTAGVCGNNDQNKNNDVNVGHNGWIRDLANLYESQRPTTNLFSWHPAPGSEPPAPTLPPFAEECDYIAPPFVRPILNHPDAEDITDLIKQSLPDNEEDAEGINFDDFDLGDLPERMPMEDAREMCNRIRATQVATACLNVFPDFDMDGFIEGCAEDLSETGGDPEFLSVAVDALENECADNGNRNLDTWEEDNEGNPIEPSKELQDAMCPNACSDHGECKATRCECEEPWSGIDCSINKGEAPTTENVVRGTCDGRHLNPCPVEVSVIGRNFWNSDKLACRFGGAEGTVTRAYYLGSIEVACEVPARSHKGRSEERASIEVTTDGENWSTIKEEVAFLWYDSICQMCTAEGCEPNPESCFIDGECYFATQAEDDNVCLRCQPEETTSAWSYTDGHHTECGPEFAVEHYNARIVAEGKAGETVLTVAAANPLTAGDAEGGAKVTYAIQTSRDDLAFQINAETGAISLIEDLVITPATHITWQGTFLVVATDGHGRTDTTTVHVEALSGGSVPVFTQDSYTMTVAENTAPGTLLDTIKAVDGEDGEDGAITYRWLQEVQYRAGAFVLDANTGEVRVGEDSPDFEDLAEYDLIVIATDGQGMYSTESVKIVVTNVNEAPKDIELTPATVPENTAAGTLVGALSAVDDDVDDTFTFRLLGGDTDKLELRDGKDIVLKVVPDFEAQAEYSLLVAATDAGGLSAQRTVKVAVTDVNEPPKNIELETTRFAENARGVLSLLTVEDDDEGDFVACTLTGTDDGHFELLGGSEQRLVLKKPLDFETATQHVITVVCEDSAGATASRQFTLVIDDAKEAPERLALAQASPLPEDAAAGTLVGTVSAVDADAGAGNLEFAVDGEGADDFEFVGQASCAVVDGEMACSQRLQVKAGASLDFDAAPTATVMVRVVDSQDRDLSLLDELEVALSNVNEAPRGLRWVAGTGKVQENAPAGTLVGQLLVDDEDSDDSFTFALSDAAEGIFELVTGDARRRRRAEGGSRAVSVVVVDGSRIDFESTGGSLPLTLTVTDEGGNSVALTTAVTVEDEPLAVVFRDTKTHFAFISEDVDVGTLVGRLEVKGLDTEGAEPAFGMAEGAAAAVPVMEVRSNGVVRTTQALDFDTRGAYLLEVTVTFADDVLPSFTDKLTVTLTDVDEPPYFVDAPAALNVKQDAGRGTTVATLVAKDPEGEHVTLALTAAPAGLVELTADNALRLLAMPSSADFAVGAYTVEVTASSAGDGDDDTVLSLTINLVDDCFEDPCSGNGKCTDVGIGAFSCECFSGWAGEACDQEGVAFGSQSDDAAAGTGMIAGIAVGMLILIVAVALVVVVVMRRRRERQVNKDLLAWSREAEEGGVFDNPTFIAPKGEEAMYAAVGAGGEGDFVPGVSNPMYGWYRPEMTRQDATEELLSCPEGAFVVRDSKATPGWHMLGVKTADAVVHEKIRLSEDGLYELLPSSGRPQPMFENVPSLVQYYGSAPRADVGYVLAVSSFDNPMYALGAGAEAGHYHTTWRRDAEAPAVPLKERELNDVAIVAAAQDDIYTNTAEAAAALRRPSTTQA